MADYKTGTSTEEMNKGILKKNKTQNKTKQNNIMYFYLYLCTVHSVFYLINTPTNAHIFI